MRSSLATSNTTRLAATQASPSPPNRCIGIRARPAGSVADFATVLADQQTLSSVRPRRSRRSEDLGTVLISVEPRSAVAVENCRRSNRSTFTGTPSAATRRRRRRGSSPCLRQCHHRASCRAALPRPQRDARARVRSPVRIAVFHSATRSCGASDFAALDVRVAPRRRRATAPGLERPDIASCASAHSLVSDSSHRRTSAGVSTCFLHVAWRRTHRRVRKAPTFGCSTERSFSAGNPLRRTVGELQPDSASRVHERLRRRLHQARSTGTGIPRPNEPETTPLT